MTALSHIVLARAGGQPFPRGRVRRHATVLFTDIEDSTAHLVRIGDDAWTQIMDAHHRIAARLVRAHTGRLIGSTGDGVLALFWDASAALECARHFTAEADGLGLAVRSGLHSGECLIGGRDVSGLTVHIAARVARLAVGGEVRVSEHTRELLDVARAELTDCGPHRLKGVPGELRLFALDVTRPSDTPRCVGQRSLSGPLCGEGYPGTGIPVQAWPPRPRGSSRRASSL